MTKPRFGSDFIKYVAIFAMLLDHIAWTFLPFDSPVSQLFHILGRMTAPIMCFFIAQGFLHTRSLGKYFLRLALFAAISQYPWYVMHGKTVTTPAVFNMIFTLFFALAAVAAEAKIKNPILRFLAVSACALVTLCSDWYVFAVLWSVVFFRFRDDKKKTAIYFSLVSLSYTFYIFSLNLKASGDVKQSFFSSVFTLGTFLSLALLQSYDETKRPKRKSRFVFYFFYPLHMLILGLIKIYLF